MSASRLRELWQLHTERRALESLARVEGLTLHDAKLLLATRAAIARHELAEAAELEPPDMLTPLEAKVRALDADIASIRDARCAKLCNA